MASWESDSRSLAVLGLLGYVTLVAGETLGVLGYGLGMVHYAPGGVFEIVLGALLVVKGFPARTDPQAPTTAVSGRHDKALHAQ